jgi:hypothetical protein
VPLCSCFLTKPEVEWANTLLAREWRAPLDQRAVRGAVGRRGRERTVRRRVGAWWRVGAVRSTIVLAVLGGEAGGVGFPGLGFLV